MVVHDRSASLRIAFFHFVAVLFCRSLSSRLVSSSFFLSFTFVLVFLFLFLLFAFLLPPSRFPHRSILLLIALVHARLMSPPSLSVCVAKGATCRLFALHSSLLTGVLLMTSDQFYLSACCFSPPPSGGLTRALQFIALVKGRHRWMLSVCAHGGDRSV